MSSVEIISPETPAQSDDLFATATALLGHDGPVTFQMHEVRDLAACFLRMSLDQHMKDRRIRALEYALVELHKDKGLQA